jgi:pimeloyl-ACP methyl ester carboxylesterase
MSTLRVSAVGDGPVVVVVGGALRSAESYQDLANELAARGWRAILVQRRGRAGSPPRDRSAGIELECLDLAEVVAEVRAEAVFGHSFGGLVALEASARGLVELPLVLYEPGVSVDGSLASHWIPHYEELLAQSRRRAAFAYFVRESAGAPAIVRRLPAWYLRVVLALMMRRTWPDIDPLLEANADEHRLVAECDNRLNFYRGIRQPVRLLGGSKSPAALTTRCFDALGAAMPDCRSEIIPGLDHFAPDEKAPAVVADRADQLLRAVRIGRTH